MFLSTRQLTELTGYKSNAGRIRWLTNNGYRFDIRGDGRPNILMDQVRERQCRTKASSSRPNLDYLNKLA
jgi:hypothetical protein